LSKPTPPCTLHGRCWHSAHCNAGQLRPNLQRYYCSNSQTVNAADNTQVHAQLSAVSQPVPLPFFPVHAITQCPKRIPIPSARAEPTQKSRWARSAHLQLHEAGVTGKSIVIIRLRITLNTGELLQSTQHSACFCLLLVVP
jgi:hypothetical protein